MGNLLQTPIDEVHVESSTFRLKSLLSESKSEEALQYACSHMQGWRKTMEDAHIIATSFPLSLPHSENDDSNIYLNKMAFFAVFDGHGGDEVSNYAAANFMSIIQRHSKYKEFQDTLANATKSTETSNDVEENNNSSSNNEEDANLSPKDQQLRAIISLLKRMIQDAFLEIDAVLRKEHEANGIVAGTTAILAVITSEFVMFGNLGDSRGLICRSRRAGQRSAKIVPMDLGFDDVSTNHDEKKDSSEGKRTLVKRDSDNSDLSEMASVLLHNSESPRTAERSEKMRNEATDFEKYRQFGTEQQLKDTYEEVAYFSTVDHKPYYASERKRVIDAGFVVSGNRICYDLALSRALGDFGYKTTEKLPPFKQAVSVEIEFTVIERTAEDLFVCIACDGVWDIFSNPEFSAVIAHELLPDPHKEHKSHKGLSQLNEQICKFCLPSQDNVTLILISLREDYPYLSVNGDVKSKSARVDSISSTEKQVPSEDSESKLDAVHSGIADLSD